MRRRPFASLAGRRLATHPRRVELTRALYFSSPLTCLPACSGARNSNETPQNRPTNASPISSTSPLPPCSSSACGRCSTSEVTSRRVRCFPSFFPPPCPCHFSASGLSLSLTELAPHGARIRQWPQNQHEQEKLTTSALPDRIPYRLTSRKGEKGGRSIRRPFVRVLRSGSFT